VCVVARVALTSVNGPTRGLSTPDRIYTSEPCYQTVKVIASVVKSDHKLRTSANRKLPSTRRK